MIAESDRPARWLVLAAFAAVYLIWGSTYLAIRFAIETLPPFGMASVRFLIAGGLLYGWMRSRGAPKPRWAEWRSAAVVGVLLLFGGNGLVVWAEQTVPSGIAALIVSSVPLFMVALDWMLGNRPPGAVIAGLVLGFGGVALLVGPSELRLGAEAAESMPFHLLGVLGLLVASLSWAVGSLYAKRVSWPKNPLVGIGMQMLMGGAALGVLSLSRGETLDIAAVSARSAGSLIYLIVFGAIVGFSAYVWLLGVVSTAQASTYAFVNPAVAVVLGWWLAAEPLTPRTLAAAAVIIAGVVLITTARSAARKAVMARCPDIDRVSNLADFARPEYPISVLFHEDGTTWEFASDLELAATLEWFDSEDRSEEATVTDALGRSVRVEVEKCAIRLLELAES